MKMTNLQENQEIEKVALLFRELDINSFVLDDEAKKTESIFSLLEKVENPLLCDEIITELMDLKMIMAKKYIKIGVSYIRAVEGK